MEIAIIKNTYIKKAMLDNVFVSGFTEELTKIADYYCIPQLQIEKSISPIIKDFDNYWEMVFSEYDFELITANKGVKFIDRVCKTALHYDLQQSTIDLFIKCTCAFPDAIIGIKLCFSKHKKLEPTLYVRTKTDKEVVFQFLKNHLTTSNISKLKNALANNKIFYGLGFSEKEEDLYLKTYVIEEVINSNGELITGFISHRLHQNNISKEHKEYLPEVSLSDFKTNNQSLSLLVEFLTHKMKYTTAGHIGMLYSNDSIKEYKIYVERKGGIPTDFKAK